MTLFAHVSGLPVEELLMPLASGGTAFWLTARAWLRGRLGRRGGGARHHERSTP